MAKACGTTKRKSSKSKPLRLPAVNATTTTASTSRRSRIGNRSSSVETMTWKTATAIITSEEATANSMALVQPTRTKTVMAKGTHTTITVTTSPILCLRAATSAEVPTRRIEGLTVRIATRTTVQSRVAAIGSVAPTKAASLTRVGTTVTSFKLRTLS